MPEEKKVDKEKLREKLEKMPIIETRVRKSKDGKWIITETIIRDIRSIAFWEKVLKNENEQSKQEEEEELF